MKTIKNVLFIGIIFLTFNLKAQRAFEVKVIGSGAPILLFPGFTCTGEVWDDTVEELSKTNECHIFTFAGFGDVPAIETPWLPKIKEEVTNYILNNKLITPTIIGHSLGGALGLWLATESNNFRKIIVVDALPSVGALMMPNFKSENVVYDNPYNKQLLEMSREDFEKMATQMAFQMTLNKEKQTTIKDWILKTDKETYVYGYTDLLKLDLREDISKIEVPVSILAGTHPYGELTVKNTYTTQYKNLSNYSIQYAKDAAHFVMFDQPEWFIKAVVKEIK